VDVGEINGRWNKYDDVAVCLNWRLVLVPAQIQDYIFAYELAHAVHDEYDDSVWRRPGRSYRTTRTAVSGCGGTGKRSSSDSVDWFRART
jgi:hypothetical protein